MRKKIRLRRATLSAQPLIQEVLNSASQYTLNTDGVAQDLNGAHDVLHALPPGCSAEQKHVFILECDGRAVGVADFIQGYPSSETGFLGLFLLRESEQKRGLGRIAYREIEHFAEKELRLKEIRLAIVDSNPVRPFWEKMGFQLTGDSRPHEGKNLKSTKRVMRKGLTIEERSFRAPLDTLFHPDSQVISREGWYQVITPGSKDPSKNEIIWARLPAENVENHIDQAIATYVQQGLTFKWCMNPFSEPQDLAQRLERRGFPKWECRAMWVDLEQFQISGPPDVTVEPVEAGTNDVEYLEAFTSGWNPDRPLNERERSERLEYIRQMLAQPQEKFRLFLARVEGKAVGTAGYIVKPDCAYFVGGNVLPEARGRGIYRALLAARAQEALERRISLAITHAREATSAPILEKIGWKTAYRYSIFLIENKI